MRFFVCFGILAVIAAVASGNPVDERNPQVDEPAVGDLEALLAVDTQGHENVGEREARQFGFGGFGGYRGGYGGYGGYRGGYGGYGGYRGGYGGYGGYRGGYGGYRGGFYG